MSLNSNPGPRNPDQNNPPSSVWARASASFHPGGRPEASQGRKKEYWGYMGILEYRDYRGIYWGYIGMMENEMETAIVCNEDLRFRLRGPG